MRAGSCLVDLLSYFSNLLEHRAGNPSANLINAGLLKIACCWSMVGTMPCNLNSGAAASVTAVYPLL